MLRSRPRRVEFTNSGVYVFESRHGPNFAMAMGEWEFDKLCLVRRGRGRLVTKTTKQPICEDDLLHLPAETPHRFVDDKNHPMTLVMICYFADMLSALPAVGAAVGNFKSAFPAMAPFNTSRTHRRPAILGALRRMVFEQTTDRPGAEAVIWGNLAHLLVMLTRSAVEVQARQALPPSTELFAQTLDFIDEHFTDPIQIKDLAAMANLSYRRYTTLFREHRGETVNVYMGRLRVAYAQRRLLETGNVLYSALEAGFGDLSHFYRVFKKTTGTTPKKFMADNAGTAPIHPV